VTSDKTKASIPNGCGLLFLAQEKGLTRGKRKSFTAIYLFLLLSVWDGASASLTSPDPRRDLRIAAAVPGSFPG
jgi:hypothetical protein